MTWLLHILFVMLWMAPLPGSALQAGAAHSARCSKILIPSMLKGVSRQGGMLAWANSPQLAPLCTAQINSFACGYVGEKRVSSILGSSLVGSRRRITDSLRTGSGWRQMAAGPQMQQKSPQTVGQEVQGQQDLTRKGRLSTKIRLAVPEGEQNVVGHLGYCGKDCMSALVMQLQQCGVLNDRDDPEKLLR